MVILQQISLKLGDIAVLVWITSAELHIYAFCPFIVWPFSFLQPPAGWAFSLGLHSVCYPVICLSDVCYLLQLMQQWQQN